MSTYSATPNNLERISLKPVAQELLYKNPKSKGEHFDVVSCQGSNQQEKNLGFLFILGHVQYSEDEDLSYLVNLISSIARREYYGVEALQQQDQKFAFELTLRKLNEVLENFLANKGLKLDIGLASLANSNLYISKIGKMKVGLARDNEFIDVINNVELFNQQQNGENLQFSNIISGQLRGNDKIFAYIPFRSITSREKTLRTLLTSSDQTVFTDKIAQLNENIDNFSCCGVHITLQEIKEISLRTSNNSQIGQKIASISNPTISEDGITQERDTTTAILDDLDSDRPIADSIIARTPYSAAMSREVAHTKRLSSLLKLMRVLPRFPILLSRYPSKFIIMLVVGGIGIGTILYFLLGSSGSSRAIYSSVSTNRASAEEKSQQGDDKSARALLLSSITSLEPLLEKENKAKDLTAEINQKIDELDKVRNTNLQTISDLNSQFTSLTFNKLAFVDKKTIAISSDNNVVTTDGTPRNIGKLRFTPQSMFGFKNKLLTFDGSTNIEFFNTDSGKNDNYSLNESTQTGGSVFFGDNLYLATANGIIKFEDITKGATKKSQWSTDSSISTLKSLTADGAIFGLTTDGDIIKYFRGKEVSRFKLNISGIADGKIITNENTPLLYLVSSSMAKIFVIDKTSGLLQYTHKISGLQDVAIDPQGKLYILTSDKKISTL